MAWSQILAVTLLAMIAGAPTAGAAQDDAPLRLSLGCRAKPSPTFQLTLANIGAEPTAAVIGSILGNDRRYLVSAELRLTIRQPGLPDREVEYLDPLRPPAIGGRMDVWLVALPPGAAYSVRLADRFGESRTMQPAPIPTGVELRVTLPTREVDRWNGDVIGLQLIRRWVGTLSSNWMHYPDACRERPNL